MFASSGRRCEHVFVGDAGAASSRFRHAIVRRNLFAAESAARDFGWLSLEYALELLVLFAEHRDPRYPRAAVRWLSRLLDERDLEADEAALAVSAALALEGRTASNAAAILRELVHRPHRH